MWLIKFQCIKSKDYNKISRLCKKAWFCPKKFSTIILVKWILLHILLKKSWRKLWEELWIPYLPIFNFYKEIKNSKEIKEMLKYFCERQIIIYIWEEKIIDKKFLEKKETLEKSLEEIKKII